MTCPLLFVPINWLLLVGAFVYCCITEAELVTLIEQSNVDISGESLACPVHLGPVVQSIVSLTTSLRGHLVKYMPTTLSNTFDLFVGKM